MEERAEAVPFPSFPLALLYVMVISINPARRKKTGIYLKSNLANDHVNNHTKPFKAGKDV